MECDIAIAALGGRVPLQDARPVVLPLFLVHLRGLGVEFPGHETQTLGAREVETGSRDAETIFGLATQELGSQHDRLYALFVGGWFGPMILNAVPGCWFRGRCKFGDHG
jgi:hypothetical protein